MNVRLKFRKEGPIRFIGHLDLMRTFQKMFMRAGVPIAYSEGFNPHQVFSFAAALSVGVTSEAEYLDMKLKEPVEVDILIEMINRSAPIGILITAGVVLPDKEPKAMAALAASSYRISASEQFAFDTSNVEHMLSQNEILIQKKNKKGKIKDIDIRPGIHEMYLEDDVLHLKIATGSSFNVKPEQILDVLYKDTGTSFNKNDFAYHRIEMYQQGESLIPLLQTVKG